jgi:pimeloyl-ACP methyl ester carboxylesterase
MPQIMKNSLNSLIYVLLLCLSSSMYAQQQVNCEQDYDVFFPPAILDTLIIQGFGPNPGPPLPPFTGNINRAVFWLHGLGGGEGAWEQAARVTENQIITPVPGYLPRKVDSFRPDYGASSSADIESAGQDVYDDMEIAIQSSGNLIDPSKSMIIAHSQGGIVARVLDLMYDQQNYPPLTHGIVTFGTPHLGARIITNKDQIFKLLDDGCLSLTAGPLEESLDLGGTIATGLAFLDDFVDDESWIPGVQSLICDKILPLGVSNVAGNFLTGTLNNFCDTCAFVNLLNNHSNFHSTHRVAFYGEEDGPEFLRLMHFQAVKGVNEYAPFEADYDSSLILAFDTLYGNYKMKELGYKFTYQYWSSFSDLANFFNFGRYNKLAREALSKYNGFRQGVNWMSTLNDKWLSIIGGYDYVTIDDFGCQCAYQVTTGEEGVIFVPAGSAPLCAHYTPPNQGAYNYFNCNWIDEETTIKTEVATDGVVTVPSAMAFPGAGLNKKDMPHSNHFQMRNDPRTKERLNELWNGQWGNWFFTETR